MTASNRLRSSLLIRENNFARSKSALIESILTPTTSISQVTDDYGNIASLRESSQDSPPVGLSQPTFQFKQKHGKSKLLHDHLAMMSKTTTNDKYTNATITKTIVDKTQNNSDDDWVCPVAVALRRAGYNVPLRPSKSWLERDRKKQALLRQRQMLFKKM